MVDALVIGLAVCTAVYGAIVCCLACLVRRDGQLLEQERADYALLGAST